MPILANGFVSIPERDRASRPRGERRILLALVLLATVMLAACGSDDPSTVRELRAADVQGVWTSDQGGTFTFAGDGTFKAEDLLGEALWNKTWEGRLSGYGKWAVEPDLYYPDDPPSVVLLTFGEQQANPSRHVTRLRSEFDGSMLTLFFFVDDPDLNARYEFRRLPAPSGL